MNIVIKSAASASLTQFDQNISYDLKDIKVYIHNTVPSLQEMSFLSEKSNFLEESITYTCDLIPMGLFLGDFNLYSLSPQGIIPKGEYKIQLSELENTIIKLNASIAKNDNFINGDIYDEHSPLLVIGRTIQATPDQVQLIAQDSYSQEICFKIKKKYDNVSFLDENKIVEVDFIPADWSSEAVDQKYIIDEIVTKEALPDDDNYILLRWVVPPAATSKAGILKLALAISDNTDPSKSYVWQTSPVNLTVQPNIAQRENGVPSMGSTINERLSLLENIFNGLTAINVEFPEDGGEAND